MRVVHVTPYYLPAREWGGPVVSVSSLAQAQAAAGAEVVVVTTTQRGDDSLQRLPPGPRHTEGVEVQYFEPSGPRRFFFSKGLFDHLQSTIAAFDVVHVHGLWVFPSSIGAALARWKGTPYVVSPRGSLHRWAMREKALKKRVFLELFDRRTLNGASLLHFTTEAEKEEAAAYALRPETLVVPNAVSVTQPPTESQAGRAGRPRLLMVGRLHPVKGFDLIIPALKLVQRELPEVELAFCGANEAGYLERIQDLARASGVADSINYLGDLTPDEVAQARASAELVVVPSHQENFGMAAAEAMLAGRPVLLSEAVGIAASAAAHNAAEVVPLDKYAIARGILRLLTDPRRREALRERGTRFAETTYSPRAVAERMLSAYAGLARTQTPSASRADP